MPFGQCRSRSHWSRRPRRQCAGLAVLLLPVENVESCVIRNNLTVHRDDQAVEGARVASRPDAAVWSHRCANPDQGWPRPVPAVPVVATTMRSSTACGTQRCCVRCYRRTIRGTSVGNSSAATWPSRAKHGAT